MTTFSESDLPPDFRDFLTARLAASDAYVIGDADPLTAVSTHHDPATIFPPNGRCVVGAEAVDALNAGGAAMFAPGSTNELQVLHAGADGDVGYWVGRQISTVVFAERDEPVPMTLRLTEVYRREDGDWKLVHRHADPEAAD